jgi:hypothetical protein
VYRGRIRRPSVATSPDQFSEDLSACREPEPHVRSVTDPLICPDCGGKLSIIHTKDLGPPRRAQGPQPSPVPRQNSSTCEIKQLGRRARCPYYNGPTWRIAIWSAQPLFCPRNPRKTALHELMEAHYSCGWVVASIDWHRLRQYCQRESLRVWSKLYPYAIANRLRGLHDEMTSSVARRSAERCC